MKGTLLIIDDEPELVKNLSDLFSDYLEEVITAGDGKQGLEVLNQKNVDCVICDFSMPIMDGLQVISKTRMFGNQVPFIFYTAFGNEELKNQVAEYEGTLFLDKPNIKELIDMTLIIIKNRLNLCR